MKSTQLLATVIALVTAATVSLSGCSAPTSRDSEAHASETGSVPAEASGADASVPETGDAAGISVGTTVLPDGVEIVCSDLDVSDLAPWGHKAGQNSGNVNVTACSSSSADIDATKVAEGRDYASACVDEHGGIAGITNLLIGRTLSGKPATLTCSVHQGAFGFNGREADIDRFCSHVLLAANGGTHGD